MLKLSTAVIAIALPFQAGAAQPESRAIVVDGTSIAYSRSVDSDGVLHLKGRTGDGDDFHFQVSRSGRLTGFVGNRSVDTRVARTDRNRAVRSAAIDLAATGTR